MTELAKLVEHLDREANALRGRAAHFQEQGKLERARTELEIEYAVRIVAHAIAAADDSDDD